MKVDNLLKQFNNDYEKIANSIVEEIKGVYVTGDIHGEVRELWERFWYGIIERQVEIDKELSIKNYNEYEKQIDEQTKITNLVDEKLKKINKEDIIIIQLGDMAIYWDRFKSSDEERKIEIIKEMPFTVLWVDGNHENHKRINLLPIEQWHGGNVHKISDNCYHLMRGEIFDIKGKKIFAFGGSKSYDIKDGIIDGTKPGWREKMRKWQEEGKMSFRIKDISWWEEEMPTKEEMQKGLENLAKNGNKVDYIVTHGGSDSNIVLLGIKPEPNEFTHYLEQIDQNIEYEHHYFGHLHRDCDINTKNTVLFHTIRRII